MEMERCSRKGSDKMQKTENSDWKILRICTTYRGKFAIWPSTARDRETKFKGKRGSRFFFPDDFESSPYPLRRYITQALT